MGFAALCCLPEFKGGVPVTMSRSLMMVVAKMNEHDKRLHIVWSIWLMILARILWPAPWAFCAVFLVGFAKECWDHRYGSGFCVFDMIANFIGISIALILTESLSGTLFEI
jgi:hypothetical protein